MVGVLVEVPVMLSLVAFANRFFGIARQSGARHDRAALNPMTAVASQGGTGTAGRLRIGHGLAFGGRSKGNVR
ncbi:hypothetical protein C0V74_06845 [Altererythrobacter sp. TH136]|nr:hypothetical protein C0V74_06845 [Altererythrobacter sp. TH136]